MPATIFNGAKVKALKETLSLNGASDIISSSTDPSVVAVDAPVGSLLLNNSSGKLYKKLDAGSSTNWQEVGAGAGGKNYIAKGAFDTPSTSGWSLTHSTLDATSKLPNQASGSWTAAAGTLSITTVGAGSQLSLLPYSLSLVSSAATTAGDMLITDALTLDQEAQASVQTFSFFYKVASGGTNLTLAGTSANSLAVAIYDVTNGAWIDPAGRYNVVQVSGVAKCAGTFQVPSNCTSVRLAVYFPNASAGAATVYLDDFYLGPQVVQYGAPVTDWQAYTPTFSAGFGTCTNIALYSRRVGDTLQVQGSFNVGTITGTTATMTIGFNGANGNVTIDPNKNKTGVAGVAIYQFAGATNFSGYILNPGTASSFVQFGLQSSTGTGQTPAAGATIVTNGQLVQVQFEVPIQGWSSSVQMSNDTDTRVVATRRTGATAVAFGADTLVTFSATASPDTHGGWVSSSQYTVPVPGIYRISASVLTNAYTLSTTGALQVYYRINNGTSNRLGWTTGNGVSTSQFAEGSDLVSFNAGDAITFRVSSSNTATLAEGFATIERLSGPSAIAASETVAARYTIAAQVASSTTQPINYATRIFDTHGAVTTGASWKFTAPVSGLYHVIASGACSSSSTGFFIYKNGSQSIEIGGQSSAASSSQSGMIQLLAGDNIDIRYSSLLNTTATTTQNWVAINRVGN